MLHTTPTSHDKLPLSRTTVGEIAIVIEGEPGVSVIMGIAAMWEGQNG